MPKAKHKVNIKVEDAADFEAKEVASQKFEVGKLVRARTDLTTTDKIVYWAILDHISTDSPHAFPSEATLAKECGISRRTVQRSLDNLEKAGVIRRHRRGGGNYVDREGRVRGRPNFYSLVAQQGEPKKPHLRVVSDTAPTVTGSASPMTGSASPMAHNIYTESSTEIKTESSESVVILRTTTEAESASPPERDCGMEDSRAESRNQTNEFDILAEAKRILAQQAAA